MEVHHANQNPDPPLSTRRRLNLVVDNSRKRYRKLAAELGEE